MKLTFLLFFFFECCSTINCIKRKVGCEGIYWQLNYNWWWWKRYLNNNYFYIASNEMKVCIFKIRFICVKLQVFNNLFVYFCYVKNDVFWFILKLWIKVRTCKLWSPFLEDIQGTFMFSPYSLGHRFSWIYIPYKCWLDIDRT